MKLLNPYLNFNGNCNEAFEFYKSVFGGDYDYKSTFEMLPEDVKLRIENKNLLKGILHISLPINKHTKLMGSDTLLGHSEMVFYGSNVSLSISLDSEKDANRIFKELANGGTIVEPIKYMFWGDFYGRLIDKFGIYWMVIYEKNS